MQVIHFNDLHIDHDKHKVPDNYMELVENARQCFTKGYNHGITKEMLCVFKPNIEKLQKFMVRFCTFTDYTCKCYINKLYESKIVPLWKEEITST